MKDKRIYLAGAITDITWEEATGWRDKLANCINNVTQHHWHCFDPCEHFNEFGEVFTEREAMEYDLDQLRHCRLVVVSMEHTQRSIGTLVELGAAHENRIPIIVYNPNKEKLHPWLQNLSVHVCTSFDGMLQFICDHYLNDE